MKVLVTGATGFVGREVLRQLHAAGHSVRVLARNPQQATQSLKLIADSPHPDAGHPHPIGWGENCPNQGSRIEPQNRSRRREEAESLDSPGAPPPHVGGYQAQVHGESRVDARPMPIAHSTSAFTPEIQSGNVLNAASLRGVAEGCDAVIHLVGIISEIGKQTFENVHTQATQNLLAEASRAGVRRWIQMSALGTRPDAPSRYHRTKWAAEEAVRASGLDWTILRPSLIYGPEDHFVNLFASMARWSPMLPVMGNGRNKLQPVNVEDVAHCFVGALTQPASIGQTVDVCGPERFTLLEILDTIMRVQGKRRFKLRIPLPFARLQAALLEKIFPALLRQAPPLNRDQLLMLQEDNVGDPQPAKLTFQLEPKSFAEGIAAYLPCAC